MEHGSRPSGGRGEDRSAPRSSSGHGALLVAAFVVVAATTGTIGYVLGSTRGGACPPASPEPSTAQPLPVLQYREAPVTRERAPAQAMPAAAAAPTPIELRDRTVADAKAGLERLRPRLIQSCWSGLPFQPSVPSVALRFDLTFDADGREIARSVLDAGREGDPAVAECLRAMDLPLTIPPPGATVAVQIDLTIP